LELKKMTDIVKNYSDIKTEVEVSLDERAAITNRRGKVVVPRKYHMTDSQIKKGFERWLESVIGVSASIKGKCRSDWFNPYRSNGGYYGGVQALYLLGANEWHSYGEVRRVMQSDMSSRKSPSNKQNSWELFSKRGAREGAASTKDLMGRIVQNFRTLQRLGGVHPYGWKLKQLRSSIDIRRTEKGIYEFRLNTTFSDIESVEPYYDVSSYDSGVVKGPKVIKVEGEVITSNMDVEVAV
jgi:hypothetical protein